MCIRDRPADSADAPTSVPCRSLSFLIDFPMLSKANFLFLKKGREPNVPARALCGSFQCSVTAAATAAAAIAAAFAAAAAPTAAAAMLVGVPCDPAHTAKHDDCHNDRGQIKICSEEFHHTKHTLSLVVQFDQISVTSILTSLLPAYLLGRTIR